MRTIILLAVLILSGCALVPEDRIVYKTTIPDCMRDLEFIELYELPEDPKLESDVQTYTDTVNHRHDKFSYLYDDLRLDYTKCVAAFDTD